MRPAIRERGIRRHGRARLRSLRCGLDPRDRVRGRRAAEAEPHAAALKAVCLSPAETRDEVKAHKLLEPFAALKYAAQQRKAEALSARLCHAGDQFIYEITLLHRDGRLTRVQMEAGTGKLIARTPHEPHEPREAPVKN